MAGYKGWSMSNKKPKKVLISVPEHSVLTTDQIPHLEPEVKREKTIRILTKPKKYKWMSDPLSQLAVEIATGNIYDPITGMMEPDQSNFKEMLKKAYIDIGATVPEYLNFANPIPRLNRCKLKQIRKDLSPRSVHEPGESAHYEITVSPRSKK